MKTLGILVLTVLFFSCASRQHMTNKTGRLGIKDSTRYELIVFDPGFDYWMATHKSIVNSTATNTINSPTIVTPRNGIAGTQAEILA